MQEQITPHKAKYLEYLKSPEWQEKRKAALARAQNRCQVCNSASRLNVHHRTYSNLFREVPADLTVLCEPCHRKHHDITDENAAPLPVGRNGKEKFQPVTAPSLPVPCPMCGAAAGKPCVRPTGRIRNRIHKPRFRVANNAASPKRRTTRPNARKPAAVKRKVWQGETLDFLGATPGATGRHVAQRFTITQAQADGRLSYLASAHHAIKIAGGWYAVSPAGTIIREPVSPGWRPKHAIY